MGYWDLEKALSDFEFLVELIEDTCEQGGKCVSSSRGVDFYLDDIKIDSVRIEKGVLRFYDEEGEISADPINFKSKFYFFDS